MCGHAKIASSFSDAATIATALLANWILSISLAIEVIVTASLSIRVSRPSDPPRHRSPGSPVTGEDRQKSQSPRKQAPWWKSRFCSPYPVRRLVLFHCSASSGLMDFV